MKRIFSFAFTILLALTSAFNARAQTTESIWLTADRTSYKTGETVLVNVNASSATPIQGFTFQVRYDPSCLRPENASSPISGMNGLPLPQLAGLVDGSYASTSPQSVNGVLAEVRFTALKGCQTNLTMENAALAIRNADGFAIPLSDVLLGERNISLFIDKEVGEGSSSQPEFGSILPLGPPKVNPRIPEWIIGIMLAVLLGLLMLGANKLFRSRVYKEPNTKPSARTSKAGLYIKNGPQAGETFVLNGLPILIGRDPQNDIYINDPHVVKHHVKIYPERNGYYLRDLGAGTFINGQKVKSSTVALHPGDVLRLGRSVLFVVG